MYDLACGSRGVANTPIMPTTKTAAPLTDDDIWNMRLAALKAGDEKLADLCWEATRGMNRAYAKRRLADVLAR